MEEQAAAMADDELQAPAFVETCRQVDNLTNPTVDLQADDMGELQKVLDMLCNARELMAAELQRESLPESFFCPLCCETPVTSMKRHGYHGFCDICVESYKDEPDGARRATSFIVRSIGLQLRDVHGKLLPLELLLATFIHELAHSVTQPEMRPVAEVSEAVLKLQPRAREAKHGFIEVHHSDAFYHNFAVLLRVAERLGIYELPALPNKFSPKALARFDNLDVEASLAGLNLGRSRLYATAPITPDKPLQVLLVDARRTKQKPVTLQRRSTAELLAQAKQRLNLRKRPTSVIDSSGKPVDDDMLLSMHDGVILMVA